MFSSVLQFSCYARLCRDTFYSKKFDGQFLQYKQSKLEIFTVFLKVQKSCFRSSPSRNKKVIERNFLNFLLVSPSSAAAVRVELSVIRDVIQSSVHCSL